MPRSQGPAALSSIIEVARARARPRLPCTYTYPRDGRRTRTYLCATISRLTTTRFFCHSINRCFSFPHSTFAYICVCNRYKLKIKPKYLNKNADACQLKKKKNYIFKQINEKKFESNTLVGIRKFENLICNTDRRS